MTASGRLRLSYCAASTRNTSTTATANTMIAVLPARICSSVSSVHCMFMPCGSSRLADVFDRFDDGAGADAGQRAAVDRGRGHAVVANDEGRAADFADVGDAAQRNHFALADCGPSAAAPARASGGTCGSPCRLTCQVRPNWLKSLV